MCGSMCFSLTSEMCLGALPGGASGGSSFAAGFAASRAWMYSRTARVGASPSVQREARLASAWITLASIAI
jgi:hypothetical protein